MTRMVIFTAVRIRSAMSCDMLSPFGWVRCLERRTRNKMLPFGAKLCLYSRRTISSEHISGSTLT